MLDLAFARETARAGSVGLALNKIVAAFAAILLAASMTLAADARAEEQAAHAMHDMSGMHDMQGMEHMDHSMHQQYMSKGGSYTSSVESLSLPDMKLVDASGKPVSLRELTDGHSAVMVNFIFTTCTTICPVMTSTFHQVQEKLGKRRNEVRMVSVSIDPENDTPARLKEYAKKYQADRNWTFLTGTLDNSVAVQKAFGVFAGEKMNHKPITFMKAKGAGSSWMRLEGLADAGQIVKEYDALAMAGMQQADHMDHMSHMDHMDHMKH